MLGPFWARGKTILRPCPRILKPSGTIVDQASKTLQRLRNRRLWEGTEKVPGRLRQDSVFHSLAWSLPLFHFAWWDGSDYQRGCGRNVTDMVQSEIAKGNQIAPHDDVYGDTAPCPSRVDQADQTLSEENIPFSFVHKFESSLCWFGFSAKIRKDLPVSLLVLDLLTLTHVVARKNLVHIDTIRDIRKSTLTIMIEEHTGRHMDPRSYIAITRRHTPTGTASSTSTVGTTRGLSTSRQPLAPS